MDEQLNWICCTSKDEILDLLTDWLSKSLKTPGSEVRIKQGGGDGNQERTNLNEETLAMLESEANEELTRSNIS